jgi:hypothetical protein
MHHIHGLIVFLGEQFLHLVGIPKQRFINVIKKEEIIVDITNFLLIVKFTLNSSTNNKS